VNCGTARIAPPASVTSRFILPASSSKTLSSTLLRAASSTSLSPSPGSTQPKTRRPGPISPTVSPATRTAARETRWMRRIKATFPKQGAERLPDLGSLQQRRRSDEDHGPEGCHPTHPEEADREPPRRVVGEEPLGEGEDGERHHEGREGDASAGAEEPPEADRPDLPAEEDEQEKEVDPEAGDVARATPACFIGPARATQRSQKTARSKVATATGVRVSCSA